MYKHGDEEGPPGVCNMQIKGTEDPQSLLLIFGECILIIWIRSVLGDSV